MKGPKLQHYARTFGKYIMISIMVPKILMEKTTILEVIVKAGTNFKKKSIAH